MQQRQLRPTALPTGIVTGYKKAVTPRDKFIAMTSLSTAQGKSILEPCMAVYAHGTVAKAADRAVFKFQNTIDDKGVG